MYGSQYRELSEIQKLEQMKTEDHITPYIGLRPFSSREADRKLFFGRNYESKQIVARILANQVTIVYGRNGVGKTSLINAQIIPIMVEDRSFKVLHVASVGDMPPITGEQNMIHNLYIFNALRSLRGDLDGSSLKTKSFSEFLDGYFPVVIDILGKKIPRIIVFDQIEELFSFIPKTWHR